MKIARQFLVLLAFASLMTCASFAGGDEAPQVAAKPFLHPLFQNDMVLQRDAMDPVWGWTEPGKQVIVAIDGKSANATAAADGKWVARIGPLATGGPYEMTVSGLQVVKLTNVLAGDVWICSGQSNMEFGIANTIGGNREIEQANHPQIRLFTVPRLIAFDPRETFAPLPPSSPAARWLVCTPQNVSAGGWGGFSAVGYLFGRDLQDQIKVPVGLIHVSWGGTVAEAWTSAEGLTPLPEFNDAVAEVRTIAGGGKPKVSFEQQMQQWYVKFDPGAKDDHAKGLGWAEPGIDDSDWKTMKLPGRWREAGVGLEQFFGVAYVRRQVDLPPSWVGHDLMLHLGSIDDRDTTWVNGRQVGSSNQAGASRDDPVPADLTAGGKLTIVVRVMDPGAHGGFTGRPEDLRVELTGAPAGGSAPASLPLAGDWKVKPAIPFVKTGLPPNPLGRDPNMTTVLYNGMIHPLLPLTIKGVIWYQGESNTDRPAQYRALLPAMIRDWRRGFTAADARAGAPADFPFLIVQIAAWGDSIHPEQAQWAELREAQDLAARTVGRSAIAVLNDIGEAHDVHPHNKQEVARRLMLDALAIAYGKDVEYSGPVFKAMQVKDGRAILSFDHLGGGLESKGSGPLAGFVIAGDDRKFVAASATIEGDTVVLSSLQVPHPAAVRYAWEDNPDKANLFSKAGLPAPAFRTDGPR